MKEIYRQDAFILTPNRTFYRGFVEQEGNRMNVIIAFKDGARTPQVGDVVGIKDIFVPYQVDEKRTRS